MMHPFQYGAVGGCARCEGSYPCSQKFSMNTMTLCERELSLSSTPHPQEGGEHNVCQDMLNEEQLTLAVNQAFSVICSLHQY